MKGKEWYQTSEVAEEYDDKRFSRGGRLIDRREKQAVLDALSPLEDKRVLEIACGTGRFTVMLAERGADITGLDISAAMLSQGRAKARQLGVDDRVEFIRGDAARLPFPDDHFDAVFAMRFFHLIPDPERFLAEMRRVTSGEIVFDTFNDRSTRTVYNWLLPMGSRLYSDRDVHDLVERAGLDLVRAEHDFLLPYGFYRAVPGSIAGALYGLEERLEGTAASDRFASVSYWTTRVR